MQLGWQFNFMPCSHSYKMVYIEIIKNDIKVYLFRYQINS